MILVALYLYLAQQQLQQQQAALSRAIEDTFEESFNLEIIIIIHTLISRGNRHLGVGRGYGRRRDDLHSATLTFFGTY